MDGSTEGRPRELTSAAIRCAMVSPLINIRSVKACVFEQKSGQRPFLSLPWSRAEEYLLHFVRKEPFLHEQPE